jgi:hypothetical protein
MSFLPALTPFPHPPPSSWTTSSMHSSPLCAAHLSHFSLPPQSSAETISFPSAPDDERFPLRLHSSRCLSATFSSLLSSSSWSDRTSFPTSDSHDSDASICPDSQDLSAHPPISVPISILQLSPPPVILTRGCMTPRWPIRIIAG